MNRIWFDFSDASTLRSDWSQGLTPIAPTTGTPVGYVKDKSGNGIDARDVNGKGNGWVTYNAGGYLHFDGMNNPSVSGTGLPLVMNPMKALIGQGTTVAIVVRPATMNAGLWTNGHPLTVANGFSNHIRDDYGVGTTYENIGLASRMTITNTPVQRDQWCVYVVHASAAQGTTRICPGSCHNSEQKPVSTTMERPHPSQPAPMSRLGTEILRCTHTHTQIKTRWSMQGCEWDRVSLSLSLSHTRDSATSLWVAGSSSTAPASRWPSEATGSPVTWPGLRHIRTHPHIHTVPRVARACVSGRD